MKHFTKVLFRGLALLSLATGCGSNSTGLSLVPARGQVLLNGAPLAGADVEFIPQNTASNAEGLGGTAGFANTNDSGNFEMYTASTPGIQPGQYKVQISKILKPQIINPEARIPESKELVPDKYNTTTELIVELGDSGKTDLKFELKSK